MSSHATVGRKSGLGSTSSDLGPLPSFLRPFVDWVASIHATVHMKLLTGFLVIAVLLLSMGLSASRC